MCIHLYFFNLIFFLYYYVAPEVHSGPLEICKAFLSPGSVNDNSEQVKLALLTKLTCVHVLHIL